MKKQKTSIEIFTTIFIKKFKCFAATYERLPKYYLAGKCDVKNFDTVDLMYTLGQCIQPPTA